MSGNVAYTTIGTPSYGGTNNSGLGSNILGSQDNPLSNFTGTGNVAIGNNSLSFCTSGSFNTSLGTNTLQKLTTGNNNLCLGRGALNNCTDSSNNVGLGYQSLYNNAHGSYNVGIGSTAGKFDYLGSYNTYLGNNTGPVSTNIGLTYQYSTAVGANAVIDSSHQIVLGTTAEFITIPGSQINFGSYSLSLFSDSTGLDVSGNVTVNGNLSAASVNTTSDYRIKENVQDLDSSFVVDTIRPVTYLNNKLQKQDIGVIAHELQEVYPYLVNGEKDGEQTQSVNYNGLIGILIKEVKDLKVRVNNLENKV